MSSGASVDCSDLIRFGSVVMRLANKKGTLHELKRGSELERGYYCLFGNLLYVFENEADANSVKGLIFLESGSSKVTTLNATPVLNISTVGGRTINLTTKDAVDLYEWQNAIEGGKIVNISRKIEDTETSLVALQHKVEKLEESHQDSERLYVEMKSSLQQAKDSQLTLQKQLETSEKQNTELSSLLKSSESERLLLLRSRGILPKRQPIWSLYTDESNDVLKCMKIWCGTWNLSGKDTFAHMQKERAKLVLRAFIPPGYDMYILGKLCVYMVYVCGV
ncbi:hypothetical protein EON63_23110 [archaeon]|nr:MAG: hypothetical protein EON63_23110 [archaeon]